MNFAWGVFDTRSCTWCEGKCKYNLAMKTEKFEVIPKGAYSEDCKLGIINPN